MGLIAATHTHTPKTITALTSGDEHEKNRTEKQAHNQNVLVIIYNQAHVPGVFLNNSPEHR